jgi:hypothetical protein
MSDPSQPQVLPGAQADAPAPASSTWTQRGGLRGCFDGRQHLALTFWLLGVAASVLISIAGNALANGLPYEAFRGVSLATAIVVGGARIAAWYAIIRCRHNTRSAVFTALALSAVGIDIVRGAFKLPTMLFAFSIA